MRMKRKVIKIDNDEKVEEEKFNMKERKKADENL